eukprot:scaffold5891_cov121-Isochrysis_galbana.AAC.2
MACNTTLRSRPVDTAAPAARLAGHRLGQELCSFFFGNYSRCGRDRATWAAPWRARQERASERAASAPVVYEGPGRQATCQAPSPARASAPEPQRRAQRGGSGGLALAASVAQTAPACRRLRVYRCRCTADCGHPETSGPKLEIRQAR